VQARRGVVGCSMPMHGDVTRVEQERREGDGRTGSGLTGADTGAAQSCPPQPCLGGDGAVRWPGDDAVVFKRSSGT
jgi:hypothetical protein